MKKLVLLLIFFALVFPTVSSAQQLHLGVEPTVIYLDTTPPAKAQAPFRIRNLSSSTTTLTPRLIPFKADDKGKVQLLLNEEQNLSSIIKKRLSILDDDSKVEKIELRAGETKELSLFMDVQKGDPVGDYYFSLVFMSEGDILDDTSTSSIPGGIAMNVMVSIGPKISASAEIEEFSTKAVVSSGPIPFTLKIQNTGNHLIQPEGLIMIKNVFGKEVGRLKIEPQYILANSSRYLINDLQASSSAQAQQEIGKFNLPNPAAIWPEKFLMGPYTATVRISLQEDGDMITTSTRFIAIPLQIILLISGFIFVIAGIILRIKLRLRTKTN